MSSPIRTRSSRPFGRVIQGLLAALMAAALASACGSNSSHPPVLGSGGSGDSPGSAGDRAQSGSSGRTMNGHGGRLVGNGDAGASDVGSAGSAGNDGIGDGGTTSLPACQPVYTSCDSLCGPVHDPCTGLDLECGTCADGLACDRDSHSCIAPKLTCDELGAKCGRIRNNSTDCGECDTGKVCNLAYNRCEPAPKAADGQCVPKSTSELCAAKNAECGYISDGCGGTVKCGDCPTGKECATDGIANRCGPPEQPWQCIVEQRECR